MLLTYCNPVWPGEFADPFVLKWQGEYYAYGTGPSGSDRVFPVLHSADFIHWEYVGGALEPLPGLAHGIYWAPEVAVHNGRFYLYYSAGEPGHDESHRLYGAVAERPEGPFKTAGRLFSEELFTIDAHPFRDPADGRWYLFFARDFFDERVGTGLAVVPLDETMLQPAGPATTILRASADWHIFARNRSIYGQTWAAWHTLEGPCVVKHEGLYYCLYSGGAWHSLEYGVSYGVASHVLGPYRDEGSQAGPKVLRTIPDKVLGPGHNSITVGPDDRTEFIVYHAWDAAKTARRMCLDRLEWGQTGPYCVGPTTEEQVIEFESTQLGD